MRADCTSAAVQRPDSRLPVRISSVNSKPDASLARITPPGTGSRSSPIVRDDRIIGIERRLGVAARGLLVADEHEVGAELLELQRLVGLITLPDDVDRLLRRTGSVRTGGVGAQCRDANRLPEQMDVPLGLARFPRRNCRCAFSRTNESPWTLMSRRICNDFWPSKITSANRALLPATYWRNMERNRRAAPAGYETVGANRRGEYWRGGSWRLGRPADRRGLRQGGRSSFQTTMSS